MWVQENGNDNVDKIDVVDGPLLLRLCQDDTVM